MNPILFLTLAISLPLTQAHAQSGADKWNLTADFDLINRCAQATRLVVGAANLYPSDKRIRDGFIEEVIRNLKKTDQLGTQMPSDINLIFTRLSVDGMLAREPDLKDPAAREWLMMQAASTCTLHSSRSESTTPR